MSCERRMSVWWMESSDDHITPGERKDRRPGNEFDSNFEGDAQV